MDVMIDIETMSSDSHGAIIAIGAVAFTVMQQVNMEDTELQFYRNIQLQLQVKNHGRHIDGNTVLWWLQQPESAQHALVAPDPIPLKVALREFREWYKSMTALKLWSHVIFDSVLLSNAYAATGESRPYSRTDCMDVRTLYNLAYPDEQVPNIPDNNPHEALWDCYRQIIGVQECYKKLGL